MDKKYTKLKDLVGKDFTVKKVWGYKWKMWLPAENRMHVAERYEKDHRKMWQIESEHGEFDVSDYQFGSMLANTFSGTGSVIEGKTFTVKSNGQEGKEIRYYINASQGKGREESPTTVTQKEVVLDDIPEDEIDLSSIPF